MPKSRLSVHVRIRPLTGNELNRGDAKLKLEITNEKGPSATKILTPPNPNETSSVDEIIPAKRAPRGLTTTTCGLNLTTPRTDADDVKFVEVLGFRVPKSKPRREKSYHGFRRVAAEDVDNAEFFRTSVSPAVRAALAGRTSCVFAYGHTGAGKSHTILGVDGQPGAVEQASAALFEDMTAHEGAAPAEDDGPPLLQVRFGEIYNGEFYDLLDDGGATRCHVREDADGRVRIRAGTRVGADGTVSTGYQTARVARSHREAVGIVETGVAARRVGSSGVHDRSSRSHAVLELEIVSQRMIDLREEAERLTSEEVRIGHERDTLEVEIHARQHVKKEGMWVVRPGAEPTTREEATTLRRCKAESIRVEEQLLAAKTAAAAAGNGRYGGTLVFVDLAGSEHAGNAGEGELPKTAAEQGECREINKSLGALGGCFRAQAAGTRSGSCYRGSKLTMVLRDHLRAPQAGTTMVAAISPSAFHAARTIQTLQYAQLVAGY